MLLFVIGGPDTFWLARDAVERDRRGLPGIIAAGGVAYFGALWLLGFRLPDFNRRDAAG